LSLLVREAALVRDLVQREVLVVAVLGECVPQ
jgi:hypothetical protein